MAEEYARRLKALIDSAEDKAAVKKSVAAQLYANITMSSLPPNMSSKDTEIATILSEFEGDEEMSTDVQKALKRMGGRTRKATRKSRKTRKYSRRR